jgi:hypothetical protein
VFRAPVGLSKKNSRLFVLVEPDTRGCPRSATGSFFEIILSILEPHVVLVWRITPMIHTAGVETLKQKIHRLQTEHRDLDDVISRLSQSPAQDQLQLQRLKKRKLFLKDQIAVLERQLTPDIPA